VEAVRCSPASNVEEYDYGKRHGKVLKNGPYEVAGGARLADDSGKEYAESGIDPLYLCRCGAAKDKPFCDGSHEDIGFKTEKTAK
jgi:CDGSH-type Zn-finger protein